MGDLARWGRFQAHMIYQNSLSTASRRQIQEGTILQESPTHQQTTVIQFGLPPSKSEVTVGNRLKTCLGTRIL